VPGSAPSEAKATKILEISGLEHHVKLAEHVHSFLLRTIESLWQEAKKLYGYRGRSAKRRFSLGLLQGFAEREPVEPSTTELVKQHDTMLRNFVRTRHPRLRKGRSTKVFCDSAYRHGHSRGRNITVHPSLDNGRNKAKEASNKQLVMKVDSHR